MGQRYSQQREQICRTVLDSREHPTAEMVYEQLKQDYGPTYAYQLCGGKQREILRF